MRINSPLEIVRLLEAAPGDLIQLINHTTKPLGLVLAKQGDGWPVVGVLSDRTSALPYHAVFKGNFLCARYHPDWTLDLSHEDAVLASAEFHETPGVVHIGRNGPMMTFGPPGNSFENTLTVDLNSSEWVNPETTDIVFPRWKIWAKDADRTVAGAKPIFTFAAAAQGQ